MNICDVLRRLRLTWPLLKSDRAIMTHAEFGTASADSLGGGASWLSLSSETFLLTCRSAEVMQQTELYEDDR